MADAYGLLAYLFLTAVVYTSIGADGDAGAQPHRRGPRRLPKWQ